MTFVFWQNILSIHQAPFLNHLALHNQVILIVERPLNKERMSEGWSLPQMEHVTLISAPDQGRIRHLLAQYKNAVHCFSGIDAFPMVYRAFRWACQAGIRPLLYIEPYEWKGCWGLLRRMKYTLHAWRFGQKIMAILTTGEHGRICYTRALFPPEKILDWGYFTDSQEHVKCVNEEKDDANIRLPRLLFVGRLDHNKQILPLMRVLEPLKDHFLCLNIIGRGPLEKEVRAAAQNCSSFHYLGVQSNAVVQEYMQQSDLLVLPSLYDGWGAVVNEALQNGVRVLCSDACGASILVDGEMRGSVFPGGNIEAMRQSLCFWLAQGKLGENERSLISQWMKQHASGAAAASYFEQICLYVTGACAKQPCAPWKS